MSLSFQHSFNADEIIECVLEGIQLGLENSFRVFQNIDKTSPFQFAITYDSLESKGCLWINDNEANAYGVDNNPFPIVKKLNNLGADFEFTW